MKNLILICFICFSATSFAQFTPVITIVPQNPTDSDSIFVIAETTFPNSPCWINGPNVLQYNNNDIEMSIGYCMGMLTAICNRTDTFFIDILPVGTYNFTFIQYNSCDTASFINSANTGFTVSPSTSIIEAAGESKMQLFPNPVASGKRFYISNPENAIFDMYDLQGKLISSEAVAPFNEILFNGGPGIYFCKIKSGGQEIYFKLVVL